MFAGEDEPLDGEAHGEDRDEDDVDPVVDHEGGSRAAPFGGKQREPRFASSSSSPHKLSRGASKNSPSFGAVVSSSSSTKAGSSSSTTKGGNSSGHNGDVDTPTDDASTVPDFGLLGGRHSHERAKHRVGRRNSAGSPMLLQWDSMFERDKAGPGGAPTSPISNLELATTFSQFNHYRLRCFFI